MANSYDVIVIGVGTAGSRAAATAAKEGAKVLAIEGAEELGGLCILRGCMPTKTLLETAHRLHEIRDAERFGIDVELPRVNFPVLMERMRQLVARFQRAKVGGIEGGGYELRRGWAKITGPETVELDGEELHAKAIVVATGSRVRPMQVPLPEGVTFLDSDHMFELESIPGSALVIGAGAVGLEFAQWLARMGSKVLLSSRSPLLHRRDPELGAELTAALSEELNVCAPSQIERIEPKADGGAKVFCRLADGTERVHEVELLLLNATGRIPNLENVGLENAGIDHDDLGLNERFQTAMLPHIFVAGDVTGERAILHEANLEGEVAGINAARMALGEGDMVEYDAETPPMEVIFTDPPVAFLGKAPQDCEAEGIPYEVATKRFPEQGRGIVVGAEHGLLRLVAEPGGGKILGCQIMGPRADDLIHIPMAVMRLGGTVKQMFRMPWYHPTLSEAFIEVCRKLAT